MTFCGQCGKPSSGAFCANCGAATGQSAPSTATADTVITPVEAPSFREAPPPGTYPPSARPESRQFPATPPPPRGGRNAWLPVTVVVVALLVIGTVGFLVLRPTIFGSGSSNSQAATPLTTTNVTDAAPSAPSPTNQTPESVSSPPSPTSTDPNQAAQEQLMSLYTQDIGSFSADGQWVAQLSSKCDGITDRYATTADGSHTFHDQDILAETQSLHSEFPGAVQLVKSTDFGTQVAVPCHGTDKTLWTTVYNPGTFTSEDDVKTWCQANFGGKSPIDDFCFPRKATAPHN